MSTTRNAHSAVRASACRAEAERNKLKTAAAAAAIIAAAAMTQAPVETGTTGSTARDSKHALTSQRPHPPAPRAAKPRVLDNVALPERRVAAESNSRTNTHIATNPAIAAGREGLALDRANTGETTATLAEAQTTPKPTLVRNLRRRQSRGRTGASSADVTMVRHVRPRTWENAPIRTVPAAPATVQSFPPPTPRVRGRPAWWRGSTDRSRRRRPPPGAGRME